MVRSSLLPSSHQSDQKSDGTVLFILSGDILYSWANGTVTAVDSQDQFAPGSLTSAPVGGLYAVTYVVDSGYDEGQYELYLAYFQNGSPNRACPETRSLACAFS